MNGRDEYSRLLLLSCDRSVPTGDTRAPRVPGQDAMIGISRAIRSHTVQLKCRVSFQLQQSRSGEDDQPGAGGRVERRGKSYRVTVCSFFFCCAFVSWLNLNQSRVFLLLNRFLRMGRGFHTCPPSAHSVFSGAFQTSATSPLQRLNERPNHLGFLPSIPGLFPASFGAFGV